MASHNLLRPMSFFSQFRAIFVLCSKYRRLKNQKSCASAAQHCNRMRCRALWLTFTDAEGSQCYLAQRPVRTADWFSECSPPTAALLYRLFLYVTSLRNMIQDLQVNSNGRKLSSIGKPIFHEQWEKLALRRQWRK